jgi:uncharacterized delta-60 repeat protein
LLREENVMKGKKPMGLPGLLVGLTAVFGTVTTGISHAQSGTPDPAFGVIGRVLTTFETATDQAFAVAIQPDGKIVAAGATNFPIENGDNNFAVVRYNPDGTMDPTFGTGGGVITNFRTDVPTGDPDSPSRNSSDTARAVLIQPDGKIVVGGFSDAPNGDNNFALVRYNPDGSVDPTFGDNAIFPGTTLTDFRQLPDGTRSLDQLRALALQPDGKIVAVGFSNAPNGEGNFALVRYNPDGIIDPTFGDNAIFPGTVLTDFGNRSVDDAFAVAMQSDGQLVVAGSTSPAPDCPAAFGLVRYNNGVPNTNFGPNNRVATCLRGTSAQASALVVQPDGRIVAVGTTNGPNGDLNFGLARYNLDGTLDPTFNADSINPGLSITDFDNRALDDGTVERSADFATAAAMQADGRIVVAGTSNAPLGVGNTNFALVRYDLNGVAITDFGSNNRVLTDLANTTGDHVLNSSTDQVQAIAIQPDGLIVVAGGSDAPIAAVGGPSFNFALVRYLP